MMVSFSETEIINAVPGLKYGRAAGLRGVRVKVIKKGVQAVVEW